MKVFAFSFCIALGFDKILTLGNVNKFPFLSLNRIFALSLDKISGTSAIKMKVFSLSFCIALGLHYLCRQNAEMVENIVYRRDTRNEWHDAGFRLRSS